VSAEASDISIIEDLATFVRPSRTALREVFTTHARELARLASVSAEHCAADVARASEVIAYALAGGHTMLACGNGGSAADVQHFVAEFVGRYQNDRRPLAAVNLTADTSVLTAVANDFGFEEVFARQVEAIGRPGDVLVVVSTSGRSPNVLRAVFKAIEMGVHVVALTGKKGDPPLGLSDAWCRVESHNTAHIQEIHSAMLHSICAGVEHILGVHEAKA
jgi:D-sedoheptulose 7-phosphate isomerase